MVVVIADLADQTRAGPGWQCEAVLPEERRPGPAGLACCSGDQTRSR